MPRKSATKHLTSVSLWCRVPAIYVGSTRILMPTTVEEVIESIVATLACLVRPQGSESAHIYKEDGGDVEAQIPGGFIISHKHQKE